MPHKIWKRLYYLYGGDVSTLRRRPGGIRKAERTAQSAPASRRPMTYRGKRDRYAGGSQFGGNRGFSGTFRKGYGGESTFDQQLGNAQHRGNQTADEEQPPGPMPELHHPGARRLHQTHSVPHAKAKPIFLTIQRMCIFCKSAGGFQRFIRHRRRTESDPIPDIRSEWDMPFSDRRRLIASTPRS